MSEQAWPEPPGGWLQIEDIGDVMTDEEIRRLGFEPTPRGWRPIKSAGVPPAEAADEHRDEPSQPELLEGVREALRKRRYG